MNQRVDYDRVAHVYEARYERNDYTGVEEALVNFVEGPRIHRQRVLEVGCGAGHWLRRLDESGVNALGLDPSARMLSVASAAVRAGSLVRGRSEALPFADAIFGCVFCVNALHHFDQPGVFVHEARRILSSGGGLLTVGLDPHNGEDMWWVYDYFPRALAEDRRRYLPAARIRELMANAGFSNCETRLIQHRPRAMTVSDASAGGFMERTSKSQLMVISEAEYEAGMRRIHEDNSAAGGSLMLRSDLRIYGSTGWTV
jgi:ubiquinone/menaquinone biosynthesis C-methylase UbiE